MDTQEAPAILSPGPAITAGEMAPRAQRWYYLDWLRIVAILTVFLYHSAKVFDYDGFMISSRQPDEGLSMLVRALELWGMALFFVIAAMAVSLSLDTRSNRAFLSERLKRLVVPLLLGIFVLAPPLVYIERITHDQFTGSFWDFLPHYFDGWYGFGGNFAWMGLHLWFLVVLFLFSLILLPLFRYLKRADRAAAVLRKFPWLQGEAFLVVLIVFTGIVESLVNLQPDSWGLRLFGGWSMIMFLVAFFLGGYLLALNPKAITSFGRFWIATLAVGLCGVLVYLALVFGFGYSSYTIPFSFFRALIAWSWIATILGVARRYANSSTSWLGEANQAVLPFYILHQPAIIVVAFVLLPWDIALFPKFLLITLASLAIILGGCAIVRRFSVLRFLFGMKPRQRDIRPPGGTERTSGGISAHVKQESPPASM